ncbi:MAG TPA: zinc ribbon domain-containing protein [Xanthobacteraceae bacterium]|jgi:putative FmdB family regulatory protein
MPIVRTYGCEDCGHFFEIWLTLEQADDPPPDCPHCVARPMRQEFKPVAIGGSIVGKAVRMAETIAAEDYGVADMQHDTRYGGTPKVRYKDQGNDMQQAQVSSWGAPGNVLSEAIALGRQTRLANGGYSGVDTLQAMLKSGEQPDLIEASKRRAMRVW